MTANDATEAPTPGRGRGLNIVCWVLQILFAAYFIVTAVWPKFTGTANWVELFDQIGIGQWFRYATGIVELVGAVGLVIPRLHGLAALSLSAVLVAAMLTQLVVVQDAQAVIPPLILFVVTAFITWVRWPETKTLPARLRR